MTKHERLIDKVENNLNQLGFAFTRSDSITGSIGGSSYFELALCSSIDPDCPMPFESICGECENWKAIRISNHSPSSRGSTVDIDIRIDYDCSPDDIVRWISESL